MQSLHLILTAPARPAGKKSPVRPKDGKEKKEE